MTEFGPADVAFYGLGRTVPCWYRCAVPANALGIEWVGIQGSEPDAAQVISGNSMAMPDPFSKKLVVLQQQKGLAWSGRVRALQDAGVTVLYEIDDYVHGVVGVDDHEAAEQWTQAVVDSVDIVARECDGFLCSTESLKRSYESLWGIPGWVCRNGLDLGRYEVGPVERGKALHVGWFGGIGHRDALASWLPAVTDVLALYDNARFVTIGAVPDEHDFGPLWNRVMHIPTTMIEQFPCALRNIDVCVAPAKDNDFFRHKSDLRFLESGALGIPGVFHPLVYGDTVADGEIGLLAETREEVFEQLEALVRYRLTRERIGDAARSYVRERRSAEAVAGDWVQAFEDATD